MIIYIHLFTLNKNGTGCVIKIGQTMIMQKKKKNMN